MHGIIWYFEVILNAHVVASEENLHFDTKLTILEKVRLKKFVKG